jgi:regulator of nucleoside diphosphate kinase
MSETRELRLTQFDYDRLWRVIDGSGEHQAIEALEEEIERAVLVAPEEVPPDVITMNSRFELLDVDTGERRTLSVVFPEVASPAKGKISILAPMGMAVLGARQGQVLEWEMPGGPRRLRVERILYQPEAAGQFNL